MKKAPFKPINDLIIIGKDLTAINPPMQKKIIDILIPNALIECGVTSHLNKDITESHIEIANSKATKTPKGIKREYFISYKNKV